MTKILNFWSVILLKNSTNEQKVMKSLIPLSLYFANQLSKRSYSATVEALRSKKNRSNRDHAKAFVDTRLVQATGGKGGNGCISLLHIFANENAGPDGGDGGNGGHVILETTSNIKGLESVSTHLEGKAGEKGYNKDCTGKNADHLIVPVPIGTVVKNHQGRVVADLKEEGMMFIAARGGAGGRGNHFFASDLQPTPLIAEEGAYGECIQYKLELTCIAHFGLLGFPNTGKSTLLQAITRANPKVASYPFTTLKPHLGVIQYNDFVQIRVADLPGLIEGSHKNKGLGISFLRHAERCMGLMILLDMSQNEPWKYLELLRNEVLCFSTQLSSRPQIIVANKMDKDDAKENFKLLKEHAKGEKIVPVSAKFGKNLTELLEEIRLLYDEQMNLKEEQLKQDKELATQFQRITFQ